MLRSLHDGLGLVTMVRSTILDMPRLTFSVWNQRPNNRGLAATKAIWPAFYAVLWTLTSTQKSITLATLLSYSRPSMLWDVTVAE